jgi:TolB protein
MAADGGHVRPLVTAGYRAGLGSPTWSPDGKRLVYSQDNYGATRPRNSHALFVISVGDGRPHRISAWQKGEIVADSSPDGSLLLVQIKPPNTGFGGDYYTMRPDGSGLTQLTHFPAKATTGAAHFSPDGQQIVFATNGVGGVDDVYTMRADGTAITPVTQTPTWESAAVWGPAH